jgi:hypothetical protein
MWQDSNSGVTIMNQQRLFPSTGFACTRSVLAVAADVRWLIA